MYYRIRQTRYSLVVTVYSAAAIIAARTVRIGRSNPLQWVQRNPDSPEARRLAEANEWARSVCATA